MTKKEMDDFCGNCPAKETVDCLREAKKDDLSFGEEYICRNCEKLYDCVAICISEVKKRSKKC